MSGKDLTKRFAHNGGFCSMSYAPGVKDRILVTCGNDDLVKLHNLEVGPDEPPVEVDHFEDSVYAVAVSPDGTRIAAGGAGMVAVLFKVEDGGADFERNATKCTLPIRDLCFSPDNVWLAVASDNEEIKVVSVENVQEIKSLQGHEGGVKSIAFDPKGEYLASAGSDRSVRLWFLETAAELKKLSGAYDKVPATQVDDGNPVNLCQLAWSPNGEFLAVAGSKDVKILERGSLKELDTCAGAHEHEVSLVQFSSNGLYLLSVDISGLIVIWEFSSRESIARYKNGSKVLAAKWDPFSNTIAIISIKGEYGLIDNVVPDTKPGPNDKVEEDDVSSEIDDEVDDLGAGGGVQWEGEPTHDARGSYSSYAHTRREPPQPAFQPQSTPVHAATKRRFLAYTTVGQITSRDETTYHAVEIEFADVNTGRPSRFNDHNGYTMAAMDMNGALFASPEVKDKAGKVSNSTIHYRPFDAWAPQSDWTLTFDEGEQAQAVAVGSSFVAVATSKRMLRIFSTSGVQMRIIMLQGPVLCMHGNIDELAVICHSPCSPGSDGSQDVHFQWMNLNSKTMVASGAVCLSPASKLEWLQLTDMGFMAIMDSAGLVSLYSPSTQPMTGHWTPVLDIKSLEKEKKIFKKDWFWPVAMTQEDVVGVVVKEEKRYPDSQMPVMSKFALNVPLIDRATTQEESFVRSSLFIERQGALAVDDEEYERAAEVTRVHLEKTLLQQVNVAITQRKLARALDLAKLFPSEKGVAAAHTLANRHRLSNLAERIDMYRQIRFQEVEEEEEFVEYEPASKRSKQHHQEEQHAEEEEGDYARQQEDDDHGSPSAKSTAETPPAPAPAVGQRRPATTALFASAKSKPAATIAPAQGGFLEKLASIKAAAAAAPTMRQKATTFGVGKSVIGKGRSSKRS